MCIYIYIITMIMHVSILLANALSDLQVFPITSVLMHCNQAMVRHTFKKPKRGCPRHDGRLHVLSFTETMIQINGYIYIYNVYIYTSLF